MFRIATGESTLNFSYSGERRRREPDRGDCGRDDQRPPARPLPRPDRGSEPEQHHRHDVEEVAILDEPGPEALVERGDLERDEHERRAADDRERPLGLGRRRAEAVDEPADADDERQDRQPEREQRHVLERQLEQAEVDAHVLGRDRVGAEQLRALADRDGPEDDEQQRTEEEDEGAPGPPEVGRRTARSRLQHRLRDDRDDEHAEEHDELRPREHGDTDRGEREQVGRPRLARDGVRQRQQRPAERRIGDDLGEQERREHDPGNGDAQRSGPERDQPPEPDPASEQEDRDRRRRDQERVQPVGALEARRHVPVAEQRRDQHRVELVDVRDQLAVQPRQQRAGLRDRDGEPLVVELVRHHEPVLHPRRREREDPAEEECDGDHRGPVEEVARPHRRPR